MEEKRRKRRDHKGCMYSSALQMIEISSWWHVGVVVVVAAGVFVEDELVRVVVEEGNEEGRREKGEVGREVERE